MNSNTCYFLNKWAIIHYLEYKPMSECCFSWVYLGGFIKLVSSHSLLIFTDTFLVLYRGSDQRLSLSLSEKERRHGLRGRSICQERSSRPGWNQKENSPSHCQQDALRPHKLLHWIGTTHWIILPIASLIYSRRPLVFNSSNTRPI